MDPLDDLARGQPWLQVVGTGDELVFPAAQLHLRFEAPRRINDAERYEPGRDRLRAVAQLDDEEKV